MNGRNATFSSAGFSIGDVSDICGIPAYTIRYWEKEFASYLSPPRTKGGQRRYTDRDVRRLQEIRRLLWVERYTVEGAKRLIGRTSSIIDPVPQPILGMGAVVLDTASEEALALAGPARSGDTEEVTNQVAAVN